MPAGCGTPSSRGNWLVPDSTGTSRLANPGDYVRLEIAAALAARETRVIPVLLEGATMPSPDELPAELEMLTRLNAIQLSDARWLYDVERLMDAIEGVFARRVRPKRSLPRDRSPSGR